MKIYVHEMKHVTTVWKEWWALYNYGVDYFSWLYWQDLMSV
jgi:hypothetical protein